MGSNLFRTNKMLSIIIPAYNEETVISKTLDSLKQQTFQDFEIIVIANGCKDKTASIAKRYTQKVITTKALGVANARNYGVKYAKYEQIMFLDADTVLQKDFLARAMTEIKKRNLDVAACKIKSANGMILVDLGFTIYNYFSLISQFFHAYGIGCCIFSTKTAHKKIKGFDSRITLGEDHAYVDLARKHFKFRILKSVILHINMRRYKKFGVIKIFAEYLMVGFYRFFFGEWKRKINYNYDYKRYQ